MKIKKFGKMMGIGLASIALILPMAMSNGYTANADNVSNACHVFVSNMKQSGLSAKQAWNVLKQCHGLINNKNTSDDYDGDNPINDLEDYYSVLDNQPWFLDDLGRKSRITPRQWVKHGEMYYEDGRDKAYDWSDAYDNHPPKGYHGPNSLRHVPLHSHKKRTRKHRVRRYTTKRRRARKTTRRRTRRTRRARKHKAKRIDDEIRRASERR